LIKDDKITKTLLPKALETLKSVREKETDEISALAAIKTLRRQIERLLRLDYSYAEISQMLEGVEIKISSERLRTLHLEVKRKSRKKNKKVNNSQNSESDTSSVENTSVIKEKSFSEKLPAAREKPSSKIAAKKKTDSPTEQVEQDTEIKSHNFNPNLIKDDDL
jgi:hypothetical protein